jgi:hypothetical protein
VLTSPCVSVNPFAKRDAQSRGSIITYQILTIVTWLMSVIVSVYYTFDYPHHGRYAHGHARRIWDVNYAYLTGFTLNYMIVSLYWYAGRYSFLKYSSCTC